MGVIYTPPARREPTRPYADAADHRLGTVWQTPDGLRWVVEWDDQEYDVEDVETELRALLVEIARVATSEGES